MENLAYYLPLLACPLMIVVLFFFMKGMMKGDNKSESIESQVQLQKNMNDLMEQNKRLMKDLEELKRAR
ncbi:DUF2933 domain-containing protein [Alkalihalobacillus deserti]|uniref:DUF2933 domain-containing protein n=1 Tax=Alkalihalobacillus deserti TaxID=2879466 RepID=UPI001D14D6CE|nr:DUF2933 domain-containing protein [Alkalihalobacillus deserti]